MAQAVSTVLAHQGRMSDHPGAAERYRQFPSPRILKSLATAALGWQSSFRRRLSGPSFRIGIGGQHLADLNWRASFVSSASAPVVSWGGASSPDVPRSLASWMPLVMHRLGMQASPTATAWHGASGEALASSSHLPDGQSRQRMVKQVSRPESCHSCSTAVWLSLPGSELRLWRDSSSPSGAGVLPWSRMAS